MAYMPDSDGLDSASATQTSLNISSPGSTVKLLNTPQLPAAGERPGTEESIDSRRPLGYPSRFLLATGPIFSILTRPPPVQVNPTCWNKRAYWFRG